MVKIEGEEKWEVESNLGEMGPIEPPEWHRIWPVPDLPILTSPPKGRCYNYKNVHNLLTDSENGENNPKKQKEETVLVAKMASIFNNKPKKTQLKKESRQK